MRTLTRLIARYRFRVLLLIQLAVVLLAGTSACSRPSEHVRIVLITLDTLRYDSFAGSSDRPSAMPRLRQWAERATVFDRFYTATASTQPSHASMFTGLHPWQHGVSGNGLQLSETHRTVAEVLRDAGFATSAVVASFPVSQRFGFGQGFDRFDDKFVIGELSSREWAVEWFDDAQKVDKDGSSGTQPNGAFYSLGNTVTARALAELDATTASRQFFWFP